MSAGSWARLLLLPAAAIAMRYSADNFKLCPDGAMRYIMDVDTGVDDAMALIGMMSFNKCVEAITVVAAAAIAMRYSADNFKLCPDGGMRYIMDVDTGVDDAMALMGMMSYNKCVEAITVVAGNTNMENAYDNTLRVLKEIGQTQGVFNSTVEGKGKKAKFLKALTNHTISCCLGNGQSPGFSLGDFLAVLALVDPASVHERLHHRVAVELTGFHTKGMLVHGWTADMLPHGNRTVDIVDRFNVRNIEKAFRKTFG
ncbi:hypothetical protein HPB47_021343 [Ixodes persulcatus]|uniref:Uncharacterized protein n=1 Tax=Ixodes persulcatus TaxID=34615 RepID=A0AC60QG15_IXOPE|nr:hypothetical protein HPB47_021343 [Ixodes persulcatus]